MQMSQVLEARFGLLCVLRVCGKLALSYFAALVIAEVPREDAKSFLVGLK